MILQFQRITSLCVECTPSIIMEEVFTIGGLKLNTTTLSCSHSCCSRSLICVYWSILDSTDDFVS